MHPGSMLQAVKSWQQLAFTQRVQALSESIGWQAPPAPPVAIEVAVCDAAVMDVLRLSAAAPKAVCAEVKHPAACMSLKSALFRARLALTWLMSGMLWVTPEER